MFQDKNPSLGAALNANSFNINSVSILNATTINASSIVGPLTGTVNGIDIIELSQIVNGADYGLISDNITTSVELLFRATLIDYGTITAPSALVSDYGTL